jgi:hypothetical protein
MSDYKTPMNGERKPTNLLVFYDEISKCPNT